MTIVTFAEADRIGDEFLDLLKDLKIDPPAGTRLDDELLSLTALVDVWRNPARATAYGDYETVLRTAAGLHDLAAKVLATRGMPEQATLIEHLRLITKRGVPPTLLQNSGNDIRDDTARKFAELYIACLAIHCGENLELDHPSNSKGANPDVMFDYNGQRWALAIKTVATGKGQAVFDRIADGAKQIDASDCDAGMVVINLKNAICHKEMYAPELPFADEDGAIAALNTQMRRVGHAVSVNRSASEWCEVFGASKARPRVLFLAQTLTLLPPCVPTQIKAFMPIDCMLSYDEDTDQLTHCLNHYMQTIRRGIPGLPAKQLCPL